MALETRSEIKKLVADTRYYYFNTKKGGVITVAVGRAQGVHYAGIAFCSPKDQFVKAKGRITALKRMMSAARTDANCERYATWFDQHKNAYLAALSALQLTYLKPSWCMKETNFSLRNTTL